MPRRLQPPAARTSARPAATRSASTSTTTTAPPRFRRRAMLLTRKANAGVTSQIRLSQGLSSVLAKTIDRRSFLKRSGLTAGAGAVAAQLPFSMIGEAQAKDASAGKIEVKRTVCTHCSVGCAIDAVVQDGVWIRQEPVFDSPINLGAHCAKGASIREHGITHDSHRLKYPMKLEGGKWN